MKREEVLVEPTEEAINAYFDGAFYGHTLGNMKASDSITEITVGKRFTNQTTYPDGICAGAKTYNWDHYEVKIKIIGSDIPFFTSVYLRPHDEKTGHYERPGYFNSPNPPDSRPRCSVGFKLTKKGDNTTEGLHEDIGAFVADLSDAMFLDGLRNNVIKVEDWQEIFRNAPRHTAKGYDPDAPGAYDLTTEGMFLFSLNGKAQQKFFDYFKHKEGYEIELVEPAFGKEEDAA
jgi:hypothetical protein